jgi:hypothetical protein
MLEMWPSSRMAKTHFPQPRIEMKAKKKAVEQWAKENIDVPPVKKPVESAPWQKQALTEIESGKATKIEMYRPARPSQTAIECHREILRLIANPKPKRAK